MIDDETEVYASAVTAWEVAIKQQLGRLTADEDLASVIEGSDLQPLPITLRHACVVSGLPLIHRDPFDRMLVAQARAERLTLLTRDRQLAAYGDNVRLV
ncbi:type II toxin-antitoxin system VapC family toxin [Skermania sp. ID1734]|nr:type II toxin-antitoxin system VapC family toxin [Skermania sp. ID1734]